MPIPTFNGQTIFGPAAYAWPVAGEPACQLNSFFGVRGLEKLNGGDRGMTHEIKGELIAVDFPSLGLVVLSMLELVSNQTVGVFTDSYGLPWPGAWVSGFQQAGPPAYAPGLGVAVSFSATVRHLITP